MPIGFSVRPVPTRNHVHQPTIAIATYATWSALSA